MFYIYTKEKIAKVKFTVNLTAKEVKDFMNNNLFLDYPELNKNDYLVIERNEAFKHPTYDIVTNTIREMTREELIEEEIEVQLSPGEYIENKRLISVPQPSSYHTWNASTHKWDINMKETKRTFRHKFQAILLEKVYEDYNYNGKIFQMGQTDELNFLRVKSAIDIAGNSDNAELIEQALKILNIEVTEEIRIGIKQSIKDKNLMAFIKSLPINWRLKDNSVAKVTFTDINNIYLMWILRGTAAQEKYTELTLKIAQAKTVEELEAIKWE